MKKTILKFLGIFLIGGFFTSLNAKTPNEWILEGSVFGNSYTIVDKSGLTLEISCTTPFYDNDEHSILLFRKYTEILERSKEDKDKFNTTHSFKFDGQAYPFPPLHTRAQKEANEWREFRNKLSEARKIEILRKNKVVGTFYPTLESMSVISGLRKSSKCRALMDQRDY